MPTHPTTHKPAEAVHQIDEPQAEALRLANACSNLTRYSMDAHLIAAELLRQHAELESLRARVQELEAQLEAIGAGGVSGPLVGRASLSANAGEPVAWWIPKAEQFCLADKSGDRPFAKAWEPLYAAPPAAQAEGWTATAQHQTYRCKIKSRKQIDKEIPRDQQGWWADVAAGQKMLLRPAVQADIDRCHLGPLRSKNPDDYMCETQTDGSLVYKIALEYMNPEENVFAAIPAPPTSADGVEHG